jgi:hypothetical protein
VPIIVRSNCTQWVIKGRNLPNFGWYVNCVSLIAIMAASKSNSYADVDGNWQWPEKTWFRQRLNELKAQEASRRRRPNYRTPQTVTDEPAGSPKSEALKLD